MRPIRTWPFDSFFWRGLRAPDVYMPPFINIVGLKRFVFSLFAFFALLRSWPAIVVKYNITAIEAIALLAYRIINPSAFLVAIVQDVHYSKNSGFSVGKILELLSMRLVTYFDMLIPVSKKIGDDFAFSPEKTRIFNGGLTRQGRSLLVEEGSDLSPYAVFAGALVPYNGIDILVSTWTTKNIDMDLHVFGKGASEAFVRDVASKNPRIIFHGFKPEEEITNWQKGALVNFCLRYSEGIDAGYFFPSKFFNIICASGAVISNEFECFPSELRDSCLIVADNLSDLAEQIEFARASSDLVAMRERRRVWIEKNASWSSVVRDIFTRAGARNGFSVR